MQDQELTGWFELSEQAPWEVGPYRTEDNDGNKWFNYWDGIGFHWGEYTVDAALNSSPMYLESHLTWTVRWRGLSSDPNAKPKPKRSGNPKVTRYVVIDVMKGEPVASFHTREASVDYAERMAWPRIKRVRHRSPE